MTTWVRIPPGAHKLKFIFDKSKVRHLGESLLPISSVQYDIGGSISLLLARVSTFNALVAELVYAPAS